MPERCQIAPESKEFEQEIRHLVVGDYRIFFIIEKKYRSGSARSRKRAGTITLYDRKYPL